MSVTATGDEIASFSLISKISFRLPVMMGRTNLSFNGKQLGFNPLAINLSLNGKWPGFNPLAREQTLGGV
jgi:hypothetical protein